MTKRLQNIERQLKSGKTKELEFELAVVSRAKDFLEKGNPLRDQEWSDDERRILKGFQLLTLKPMLYVVNVSEGQLQDDSWRSVVGEQLIVSNVRFVPVCIKMEAELASMNDE